MVVVVVAVIGIFEVMRCDMLWVDFCSGFTTIWRRKKRDTKCASGRTEESTELSSNRPVCEDCCGGKNGGNDMLRYVAID